jgi:hypothetical protein
MTNKGADNCNCNNHDNHDNDDNDDNKVVVVAAGWEPGRVGTLRFGMLGGVYFTCDSLSLSTMPWVVEGSASS